MTTTPDVLALAAAAQSLQETLRYVQPGEPDDVELSVPMLLGEVRALVAAANAMPGLVVRVQELEEALQSIQSAAEYQEKTAPRPERRLWGLVARRAARAATAPAGGEDA